MVDLEESFEYERKFLVTNPGVVDGVIPEFILQGYLTVAEHYAVRVRLGSKVGCFSEGKELSGASR